MAPRRNCGWDSGTLTKAGSVVKDGSAEHLIKVLLQVDVDHGADDGAPASPRPAEDDHDENRECHRRRRDNARNGRPDHEDVDDPSARRDER